MYRGWWGEGAMGSVVAEVSVWVNSARRLISVPSLLVVLWRMGVCVCVCSNGHHR